MEVLKDLEFNIQENMEDELVQQALMKGIDLREYSKEIEDQLNDIEQASISDYLKESSNIASLHGQIVSCDSVLERMESMLEGFQLHLGNISSEIHALQQQSMQMNIKLKNRQAVRGELSQYIDELIVSEAMINHILETKVTEREFLEQLHELNQKINFVKEQSFKDSRSVHDVHGVIDKLKFKAVAKIREFCLTKINLFKKPLANYQITQNALLKFKFYFEFIACQAPQVARRGDVLTAHLESPAVVPHTASKDDRKFSYEQLFRSIQFTLLDNACREYLFLSDFFMLSGAAAAEMFNAILGKTLDILLKEIDSHVKETYDAISLFICVQLVNKYQLMANFVPVGAGNANMATQNGR
ncbi:VPS52 [Bugula neritina]|uniref:Vacuolar protein sorting-associated protein 52 homolog n=1 Tax=Bugula neritina TaxID=10212 RepID=A0A7J7KPB3_BUGNE|nr:VPS52 [Bugula neritina]